MERPIKHVGNAGDEAIEIEQIIDGVIHTFTVEPREGLDVPLSDEELADYNARLEQGGS